MAINIHGLIPYNDFNSNINTIEVHDVDELEIVAETSIGLHVAFGVENMGQVSETFVPPIVKAAKAGTSTTLGVQVHSWYT